MVPSNYFLQSSPQSTEGAQGWNRRFRPVAKLPLHKECSENLVVGGYEERKSPDQRSVASLPDEFAESSDFMPNLHQ